VWDCAEGLVGNEVVNWTEDMGDDCIELWTASSGGNLRSQKWILWSRNSGRPLLCPRIHQIFKRNAARKRKVLSFCYSTRFYFITKKCLTVWHRSFTF